MASIISEMIERENRLEDEILQLQMGSLNVWLFARDFAFEKLKVGTARSNSNNSILLSKRNCYSLFTRTLKGRFRGSNLESDTVLAVTSSVFRRIVDSGYLYNFLIDPLILSDDNRITHIELPRFNSNNPIGKLSPKLKSSTYFPDLSLAIGRLFFWNEVHDKVCRFLEQHRGNLAALYRCFKFSEQESMFVTRHLEAKISNILLIRKTLAKFLVRDVAKTVLVAAGSHHYLPESLCKNRIIEIQHGTIHENHAGYFLPRVLDFEITERFPHYEIALWDNEYKRVLIDNRSHISKENMHIVGFPSAFWISRKASFTETSKAFLVVSQPGEAQNAIASALKKLVTRFPQETFILKLHPAEQDSLVYSSLLASKNVIMASSNVDVYELMSASKAVIGFNSTVLEEASLAYNLPVYFVDESSIPSFWFKRRIGSSVEDIDLSRLKAQGLTPGKNHYPSIMSKLIRKESC